MATKVKLIADSIVTTDQLDTASLDAHFTGGTGVTYSGGTISIGQAVHSTDSPTFADLTVTGNLNITGDINSYNVTDLDVTDKTITLGAGQIESNSGGSGIIVDGSGASILWDEANTEWDFNSRINVPSAFSLYYSIRESGTQYGFIGQHKTVSGTGTDTSLSIFSETGDGINFLVNGSVTKAVVIDSEGDVGIGDSAPSFKLDVNNTSSRVRFKATTGDSNLELSSVAGRDYLLQSLSNSSFRIYDEDANSGRLSINSTGYVGIGIDNSSYKLQVTGALGLTNGGGLYLLPTDASDTDAWIIYQYSDDTLRFNFTGAGADEIIVKHPAAANTTTLGIDTANQRLGIGTSDPFSNLHVYTGLSGPATSGNLSSNSAIFSNGNAGRALQIGTDSSDTYNYIKSAYVNNAGVATTLKVFTGNTESLTLTTTGVGVNNSNPAHKLDVHGDNNTIVASFDHTSFSSRQVGMPGRFMVGPYGNGYPWAGYNFSHFGNNLTRISGDTAWAINYGNGNRLSFNYANNQSAGTAITWTELGYFDANGKFSPRQQIEVGVFSNSQNNTGEAWIGRASDRQDGTLTIQLGGDNATGTNFEIVDRAWTKVISYISGEAPGESLFVNSNGDLHFGGNNQGRIKTNSNSVYIDAIPTGSHLIFRNNGSVEKMHITDTGSVYHPEQGSNGDYTSYIGSVSNQGGGARYMHVNISTAYGDMFWIEVKGYDYGAGLIDGRSGGYIYNTGSQTNVYAGVQSGDIFTQYQLTNGTLEVVIDTGQSGTTNRWGSMVFRGGTDTINGSQPLEIIQYSYSSSTSKVY